LTICQLTGPQWRRECAADRSGTPGSRHSNREVRQVVQR
jgi:hypothetical protein